MKTGENSLIATSMARLIEQFQKMPGIGHKSAQRLAYYVLNLSPADTEELLTSISDAHEKIKRCKVCLNLAEDELCPICKDPKRDDSIICVVEDSRDVIAIENTGEFHGKYHVLGGVISPMNNVGPEDISIKELIARLSDDTVTEVIMATNPTVEGEATAVYISRLIKPMGVTVSRLAYGVPVGGDIECADEITLLRAIEGRKQI